MAKSPKSDADKSQAETPEIIDAEIVEQTVAGELDAVADAVAEETPEDLEVSEAVEVSETEDTPIETPEESAPMGEPATEVAPEPEQSRGGFIPLVLGGVIAAGLGYGVAQIVPDGWPIGTDATVTDALASGIDAQADRLAAIEAGMAEAVKASDIAALSTQISDTAAGLAAQITALEARVVELEQRPLIDLSSFEPTEAVSAEIAAIRIQIEEVAEKSAADLAAAQAETSLIEIVATQDAEAAAARAAVSRLMAALDSGSGYRGALDDLAAAAPGVVVAPVLVANAASGVASLVQLQAGYPEAARAALAVGRSSEDGIGSRVGNFFKAQLGVRSLEPQDGASVDAILSRAEAALSTGRLNDALAEVATLPEASLAAMAAWSEMAQARLDTQTAANTLSQSLNSN